MDKNRNFENVEPEVITKQAQMLLSFHGIRRGMRRRKIMGDFGYTLET